MLKDRIWYSAILAAKLVAAKIPKNIETID
jgi:hypothetical protein